MDLEESLERLSIQNVERQENEDDSNDLEESISSVDDIWNTFDANFETQWKKTSSLRQELETTKQKTRIIKEELNKTEEETKELEQRLQVTNEEIRTLEKIIKKLNKIEITFEQGKAFMEEHLKELESKKQSEIEKTSNFEKGLNATLEKYTNLYEEQYSHITLTEDQKLLAEEKKQLLLAEEKYKQAKSELETFCHQQEERSSKEISKIVIEMAKIYVECFKMVNSTEEISATAPTQATALATDLNAIYLNSQASLPSQMIISQTPTVNYSQISASTSKEQLPQHTSVNAMLNNEEFQVAILEEMKCLDSQKSDFFTNWDPTAFNFDQFDIDNSITTNKNDRNISFNFDQFNSGISPNRSNQTSFDTGFAFNF